ncbi:MAG: N-acetylmuramoyl-L-alanine amidase [Acidobacteria bacterium]|nr:N-acetylmuramoyl-L-alanine amidase [Acidobacteriota bacterium]
MPPVLFASAPENFRAGRPAGFTPEAIVLHRTGGSRDSLRARFNDPAASLSAHYVVGRDGRVDQYVLETDTAFHAGVIVAAAWPLLRARVNPNFYTIGIELEGEHAGDWPDPQIAVTAALISEIARRWQIPIDADHVVPHSAIRASSGCPAVTCPVASIIQRARSQAAAARVPQQTVVHTLALTNLRHGSPSLQAPIVRVIPPDTGVVVSAFTDTGERVNGSTFWYVDGDDRFFWAGATDVPSPTDDAMLSPIPITPSPSTDAMELAALPTPPPGLPDAGMTIDRTTFVLPAKEFFSELTPKDLVVLHFTAGRTARSAFDTWRNDPAHIGTSYIVDVDGTIYEVFSPSFWAAHLGVAGTKNRHDRRSIGIEIANVGPLQPSTDDPSILNWWFPQAKNAPQFTTKFCRLDETDKYVKAEYREQRHFASFPDVQVDAVAALVGGLCDQFSITATLPPLARRFDCDLNAFARYKGVCTHANFRQDKWDIGPAFPWERLRL